MNEPTAIKDILENKSENLEKKSEKFFCEKCNKETGHPTEYHGKNGGVRAGGGRPKGSIAKSTRTALEAKNRFIQRVQSNVDKLFDAQLDLATGEKVLMVKITERDDDGKIKKIYHEIVDDPEIILQYMNNEDGYNNREDYENINTDEEYYYMTVKPANNQAIQGMLDRAFGKAPEKIEIEGGFFKAEQLNIQIIQPEKLDSGKDRNIIEVEREAESRSDTPE